MSSENKNEQFKSIKEIGTVIGEKIKPLLAKVYGIRDTLGTTVSKIEDITDLRAKKRLEEVEKAAAEEAEKVRAEAAANAPAAPLEEEEVPVRAAIDEAPSTDAPEQIADVSPAAEEKAEEQSGALEAAETPQASEAIPMSEENSHLVASIEPIKPKHEKSDVKADGGGTSTTYINPDIVNGKEKPSREQGQYNRGQGGYQGNRPQGQGYQGTRPSGPPRTGQTGFAPRPGGFVKFEPAPLPTSKDAVKKKKPATGGGYAKDDRRTALNKRDLVKKGYVYGGTGDDEYARYVKARRGRKDSVFTPQFIRIEHAILTSEQTPIKVFAEKIGKPATEIVKRLFEMDKLATINDAISFEDAEFVALEYNITLELRPDKTAEDKLADIIQVEADNDTDNVVKRPPIVTIMGHVDHGKTSLLDYIRKASVVKSEAGGITQHIGAYTIDVNDEKITFLDTPGHEAFTAMRKRGANVTDIAIIVVAADDGIMPQTVEAINHAKDAGVSIIVAVNKIDKTGGDISNILQQLSNHGLLPEAWGGDTIVCPVSAKTGEGVQALLESVLLVAEVLELKASEKCAASGSIIEARLDKGVGPVATVLVQNGTLKVADYVVAGTAIGKIRAMTDHNGKRVKEAGPSYAVQVQGFADVPNAGDKMVVVKDEKLAKKVAQERADKERSEMSSYNKARSLDDMFKDAASEESKVLSIIIKADVQGSAEAVKQSLLKLSDDMNDATVSINVIHDGVGAINESDVMLADTASAIIIGFNVRPEPKAKQLAERSGVDIRNYRIIYDAIDDITKALKGMLKPVFKEVVLGHAEVREVFKISSYGTIAGSYVTDGKVSRKSKVRLLRENIVVFEGMLDSLRRGKEDVKDVAFGYECGIGLDKFNDIKKGDIVESFIMEEIKVE